MKFPEVSQSIMRTVIIKKQIHRGENQLLLSFKYDLEQQSIIKEFANARWSITGKCWHVPDNPGMVSKLESLLKGKAILHFSDPKPEINSVPDPTVEIDDKKSEEKDSDKAKIEDLRKWMIHRRYSDSTVDCKSRMSRPHLTG